VLKRHERIQWLRDKGKWPEGRSVLGLPKVKQIMLKTKKSAKTAADGTEEPGAAPPPPAAK